MIIVFSIAVFIASIIIIHKFLDEDGILGLFGIIGIITLLLSGLLSAIMITSALINNAGARGSIGAYKERYESLMYQLENNLYDNVNDLGKKELYNQIQEWNEDLARGKAMQNDFWFGVFYPDIYEYFEFIDIDLDKE